MAHIIVIGNEKGGAGKSTMSMHVATALARLGFKVGALDIDLRQQSLARYFINRAAFVEQHEISLPSAVFETIPEVQPEDVPAGENLMEYRLSLAVAKFANDVDFIVIDCPGSHTRLSQIAHSLADTLVTPLNDSFIDFDLLAHVDGDGVKILGPSIYSQMVWNARQIRAQAGLPPIDWVVMRNRLGSQNMVNKKKMESALARLSKRIGFRIGPGFHERVIFRELFPRGLTLLDLKDLGVTQLNMSNVAARQELRDVISSLNLPGVTPDF